MNFPVSQHIVPEFILKNFTDKYGRLHCYHKPTGTTFAKKPKETLKQRYFYTERTEEGTPTNDAEFQLRDLENAFKPLSKRLIACARANSEIRLSTNEIDQVRKFVLVQFRRSRRVNTLAYQVSEDGSKVKNVMADLIFDNPLHPKLEGAVTSTGLILGIPAGSRKAFIIGDSPVALQSFEGTTDSQMAMPIANDVVMALSSKADRPIVRQIDQWQVGAVNKEIAKYSDTFASHHEAYTAFFRKANLNDKDWPGA